MWQPPEVRAKRLEQLTERIQREGYPTRGKRLAEWAREHGIGNRTMQKDLQHLRHLGVGQDSDGGSGASPEHATNGAPIDLLEARRALLVATRKARKDTTNGMALVSLLTKEEQLLTQLHAMEQELRDSEEQEKDFDARLEDLRRDLAALPAAARRRIRDVVLEVCDG